MENRKKVDIVRRTAKYFNLWRRFFQHFVSKVIYGLQFKFIYKIEVEGKENIPKDCQFIVCGNHLSVLDPYILSYILPKPVAFMAKKELFEKWIMKIFMDWQGAFPVNREKLDISTIKTALEVKNTNWVLGIFPQGTREQSGVIENIHKGFAGLARTTKCNILPVGIVGSENIKWCPFSGKIKVKIGEMIPYSEDLNKVVQEWGEAIQNLTGFKYIPNQAN